MTTDTEYFGYTYDEWQRLFRILEELRAVHPDMNPKFWEGEILEMAQIVNAKARREVAK